CVPELNITEKVGYVANGSMDYRRRRCIRTGHRILSETAWPRLRNRRARKYSGWSHGYSRAWRPVVGLRRKKHRKTVQAFPPVRGFTRQPSLRVFRPQLVTGAQRQNHDI